MGIYILMFFQNAFMATIGQEVAQCRGKSTRWKSEEPATNCHYSIPCEFKVTFSVQITVSPSVSGAQDLELDSSRPKFQQLCVPVLCNFEQIT